MVRQGLRRYRFELAPGGPVRTVGVTAFDRADAERQPIDVLSRKYGSVRIVAVIEDIDVSGLDAKHVLPNMGDCSIRGIWWPQLRNA